MTVRRLSGKVGSNASKYLPSVFPASCMRHNCHNLHNYIQSSKESLALQGTWCTIIVLLHIMRSTSKPTGIYSAIGVF